MEFIWLETLLLAKLNFMKTLSDLIKYKEKIIRLILCWLVKKKKNN
jgi:hypothetical protein